MSIPEETSQPNELRAEILQVSGLNPFQREDSSARVNMFSSSHIAQSLVIEGATPRRIMTGVERKFGRTTFKIKMPCNATVLKVFDKYPTSPGYNSINSSPTAYVIYEENETREIGILEIPTHHSLHQHFGFKYKRTSACQKIFVGSTIRAGTVFADSPAVTPNGDWCYGVESKVALMSVPGVIEDGVVVSESYLKKLKSLGLETMVESWGKEYFPLNLYGDDTTYKPFPDIGERIRENDGLLFALRRYDEMLAPVEMTPKALREIDYNFDRLVYATPGAKIVDVSVKHDNRLNPPPTPVGMEEQTAKYYNAEQNTLKAIIRFYHELQRKNPQGLKITKEFSNFLVDAILDTDESGRDKSVKMYRRIPLDDWRVEITYEYDIDPTVTFKLTACHGNKGVICSVLPDQDMPVDKYGNRAEIIMEPLSVIKRENPGVASEMYIRATQMYVDQQIRQMMADETIDYQSRVSGAYTYLLEFYRTVSPRHYDLMMSPSYVGSPEAHVKDVVENGTYLFYPTDNPTSAPAIARGLRDKFPIEIGPVTYRGRSGNLVTTKYPVLIGGMYVLLLEKTGSDWSAVSSAKLQHFGLPSKLTNRDKHSAPGRNHPVRLLGEDEVRLFSAMVGSNVAAEFLEMSNNPKLHKHIMANILRSDKPTGIENIIDRNVVPKGDARPLVFARHMLECAGMAFEFEDANKMPADIYVKEEGEEDYDSLLDSDDVLEDEENADNEE